MGQTGRRIVAGDIALNVFIGLAGFRQTFLGGVGLNSLIKLAIFYGIIDRGLFFKGVLYDIWGQDQWRRRGKRILLLCPRRSIRHKRLRMGPLPPQQAQQHYDDQGDAGHGATRVLGLLASDCLSGAFIGFAVTPP